jgi:hypothetical protein
MTFRPFAHLFLLIAFLLTGCKEKQRSVTNFEMGERTDLGPFTYVVVESAWSSQLGEGFQIRTPQHRFLTLTLSVTNRSTGEASVPMLALEASNGAQFPELTDGNGVGQWLGILRTVGPAQSIQGRILFDVPLSTFKLRLTDGGETGYDKYAWVSIPLSIDSDQIQTPLPGPTPQMPATK